MRDITLNQRTLWLSTMAVAAIFVVVSSVAAYEPASSSANGVRIDVTPLQLESGKPARFEVRLNTHTVELMQNLTEIAELRDDKDREYRSVKWEGSPPGGHHRSGILEFPNLGASVTSVVLILPDVAGVPVREFRWSLKP